MSKSIIRFVLTQAVVQQILVALKGVADRLPFLTNLTPQERKSIPKTGRKRLAFVQRAAEVARQNEGICPKDFDASQFVSSADLLTALMPAYLAMQRLLEEVSDTVVSVGSDSYSQALDVYDFVKRLKRRLPGMDSGAADLVALLKESRNPEPAAPPTQSSEKIA